MFGTTVTVTLTPIVCANCGCNFGMDERVRQRRLDDHEGFYCPNGHKNYYNGESEAERLKREKQSLQNNLRWAEQKADSAKRELTATKGQFTKYRNRVAKGVCPCCNLTFANVAAHMASQHPEEIDNKEASYVEPSDETNKSQSSTKNVKIREGDKITWRGRKGTFIRYSRNPKQALVLIEGYTAPAYKPITEILKAED